MSKLYIKCLTLNESRKLVSCHGGDMVWGPDRIDDPNPPSALLCKAGFIHGCRLRDFPAWVSTHNVVVEVEGDVLEGPDKVGFRDAKIVRIATNVDGLDVLVAFAEFCAEQGENYTDEKGSAFLVSLYPTGFFDGVEA